MPLLSTIAVSVLAVEHVYIMVLEMFLWTTPRGLKAFGMKKEFAEKTKTLAANQGLVRTPTYLSSTDCESPNPTLLLISSL